MSGRQFLADPCCSCGKRMSYRRHYVMLKERLWLRVCAALEICRHCIVCVPCVEKALGRPLCRRDLIECPVNDGIFGFDRSRLPA